MHDVLDRIAEAVRSRNEIADWSVQRSELRSTQFYLVGTATESRRFVKRVTCPLTIYHDHPGPDGAPSRGAASVTILQDGSNLDAALDEAVIMSSLVHNRPYSLAGSTGYTEVPIADSVILEHSTEAAESLLEQLIAAIDREHNVRLSSAEVFLEQHRVAMRNSRGVAGEALGTKLLLDFVLVAGSGSSEMEAHIAVERRRLADLDVATLVARQATYARDSLAAVTPQTGHGPVLLRDEALVDLLGNYEGMGVLAFHASAAAKYHDLSRLHEGQPITGEQEVLGDRLTYSGSRLLPFGLYSGPFDIDGLPAHTLAVIADSRLERRWATQRYAEYLGIPATGSFGNALVAPGSASVDDLLSDARLQVVSFSWMNPDVVTGNFVAEIRLGYEYDGNGWRPIRGGSLSGNLFTALADVRFSRQTGFYGHYQGPIAARFGELTISGA